ncbi:tyrosine-type recombinase/integrase [Streptomyces cinnamoneus]|uniref:tyrosine-type recombinase/integrase n=1 Tax=Streptomyces cinnamoneus TaxID=53446 RepID=UPI0033E57D0C
MATIFQKCKTDPKSQNYPCSKTRCGHNWTVRYREPGGRTARQREKTFAKKTGPDGADAWATKVEHDKGMGIYLDPNRGSITLQAWAREWLGRQIIGESTLRNYRGFIENYLVPHLGRKTLAGLSKKHLEVFVVLMHDNGNGLAASTINDRMRTLSAMLEAAVRDRRISENPAKGMRLPRTAAQAVDEDDIPALGEVALVRKHITPKYRLTIDLQAGVGLRISETLAFAADCPRDGYIRVRRQVSSKPNRLGRKALIPLKHRVEGEYRDIPTAPFLDESINGHVEEWGVAPLEGVEVLFGRAGEMPTASSYGHHFRRAVIAAGLVQADGAPKYTPHSLRHFFASTALANGIPIHEVSRWLGHKSIKTTVDIYGHLVPGAWDRCREVMQRVLRPLYVETPAEATGASEGYEAVA